MGTSVKAEVQMLAEGLHGQVLRKSVCLVWLTNYCWGEKKVVDGFTLFDRKFAIKTS